MSWREVVLIIVGSVAAVSGLYSGRHPLLVLGCSAIGMVFLPSFDDFSKTKELPRVASQPRTDYVDFDPDFAAIGLLEPELHWETRKRRVYYQILPCTIRQHNHFQPDSVTEAPTLPLVVDECPGWHEVRLREPLEEITKTPVIRWRMTQEET